MKKILLALILIVSVEAKPKYDWYVGIGYVGGDGEQTQDRPSGTTVVPHDVSGADIKLGVIFATNNRFEFSWSSVDAETTNSKATFDGKEADWIFTTNLNNKDSLFLPFFVAGVGSYEYSTTTVGLNGFSMQAGVGVLINLDLEVEISYKNRLIFWEEYSNINLSENMQITYVGVKYKF